MLEFVGWQDVLLLLVLVFAALVARALVLFGILPFLSGLKFSQNVENRFKIVILWGGLRGAVTLALALAVTENPSLGLEIRRFVGVLATGFVLFTLLVNGTTLRGLIHVLGLDLLSPFDEALRKQVLALSRERVLEAVKTIAVEYKLQGSLISEPASASSACDLAAEPAASTPKEDPAEEYRIVLGLIALSSHEREVVLQQFAERTVSGRTVEESLAVAGQLIDHTRTGGQLEYLRAAQRMVDFSRRFRIAHFLHRHFSIDRELVDRLADRFELLLFDGIVLSELECYLRDKLPALIGRDASMKLQGILQQRIEMTAAALDALRQQYPAYAQLLERRILNRIWLRREEKEYRALFEDGVVGPELYNALRHETALGRAKANERPRLDLGLETRALISKVPIFAALAGNAHNSLARLLRPRFAVPGERLIRDGDAANAMYFLSSGTVEVRVLNTRFKLRAGDFFGEMGLVTGQRRQGDVYAISYCQLLMLKDSDLQRLLRANPELQERINAVTSERLREDELARNKL
jgi:monovalent cation:H+ antiporter, CPA1 family